MSDWVAEHENRVTELFQRLGADPEQAAVMARQLLKRAEQVVAEEGISKLDATETLLKKVIEARQGS